MIKANSKVGKFLKGLGFKTKPRGYKTKSTMSSNAQLFTNPYLNSLFSTNPSYNLLNYSSVVQQINFGYKVIPWVFGAINKISEDVSSVRQIPYKKVSNGKKRVDNKRINDIMRFPNRLQSFKWLRFAMNVFRLITGNSYLAFDRGSITGEPVPGSLRLRFPQYMYPEVENKIGIQVISNINNPIRYVYSGPDTSTTYDFDNIIHYMYNNPESEICGLSPITISSMYANNIIQAQKWNSKLIAHDTRIPGLFSIDGEMSKEDKDYLRNEFKARYSNNFTDVDFQSSGGPIVADNNMKYTPFAISPKDMDYIESQKFNIGAIATIFGLPTQMIGLNEGQTYANFEQAVLIYYWSVVIPLAQLEAETWSLSMYPDGSYFWQPDVNSIPAIMEQRLKNMEKIDKIEMLTPNEKREMVGFERIDNENMDNIYMSSKTLIDDLGMISKKVNNDL